MTSTSTRQNSRVAQWTFWLLSGALLALMVWASTRFGTTWDERDRHRYGQDILEFFQGLRSRAAFIEDGGHLYGGLFDTICAALERWVHVDRYVLRHIVNAIFGWAGVFFAGRLAGRLFGRWTGVLALVLLASSPRYFADAMNNPKDLPFAATSVAALYYLSTISPRWPYLSAGTMVKIAVALALALNIRAAALLYLGYLGLLVAVYVVAERAFTWRQLADTAVRLALVAVAVLLLGTLFWPWAQARPFTRPFEALLALSDFPYTGTHLLFDAYDYNPAELPWYYVPWWMLISFPPVVLAGIALSSVSRTPAVIVRRYALWATAALPVAMIIVKHSTLYNAIRHVLFVYPILVVLAASGWTAWLSIQNRRWVRQVAAAALAVGLANILIFDIRSHPNETVYFNEIVGGPRGAFGKYEMDYWGNCVLQAVTWSADAATRSGVPIAVSGDLFAEMVQPDAARFDHLLPTPPAEGRHALWIQLLRGSVSDMQALAARSDAVHRVQTADGAVLCVVFPGPKFEELHPQFVDGQLIFRPAPVR